MNQELLRQPFEHIKQRKGAAGRTFDYVGSGDIIERVLTATEGAYDWEILRYDYHDAVTVEKLNRSTGEVYSATRPAYWVVHGRLTLPGLGSRDGIGTQVEENEDSAKGAETDAFKRAAVKFGVALSLYQTDDRAAPQAGAQSAGASPRAASPAAIVNHSAEQCPECHAPAGKSHTPRCKRRAGVPAAA